MNLINKRELNKRIVAVPNRDVGYAIKHDISEEQFVISYVPSLEIAGCIVKALRERQLQKLALHVLVKKHSKKRRG